MINLYSVSTDVMNILGYSLLALIAVGFILCWIVMGITTVKAFRKKDKNKKKKKFKSSKSVKTEERKIRNNSMIQSKRKLPS